MFGLSVEADPQEFRDQFRAQMDRNPNITPQQRQQFEELAKNPEKVTWWCYLFGGGSLAAAALTAFGAIAMLVRRMYWLALLGALAALNPIDCCCLDLNIPFAIWALIVLASADGRFQSTLSLLRTYFDSVPVIWCSVSEAALAGMPGPAFGRPSDRT